MDWQGIGRSVMLAGGVVFLLGAALYALGRLNLPLGRLPGDIVYQRGNFTCVFPLATSILLSIVLTVLLNLLARWWR